MTVSDAFKRIRRVGGDMHAFDLSKVRGRKIIVRRAHEGETLTTLDGSERALRPNDLVICDRDRATGLAGIMGGEESEIVEGTTEVMFECASFDRTAIRLTSRALGMRTEASGRFERGVSPATVMILDIVHTSQNQPFVRMSPDVSDASDELRAFLFERVYNDDWRALEEKRCDYVLTALFEHFAANPTEMPDEYVQLIYQDGVEGAVCDFLAGMTDRFATDEFTRLYVPGDFSIV